MAPHPVDRSSSRLEKTDADNPHDDPWNRNAGIDISTWHAALCVSAVVLSGLISGQMLAIALANQAAQTLPEKIWTLRFQVENALFSKTMPAFLLLPLLGLVALAFVCESQQTHDATRPAAPC
jgi:hypothetical protein